MIGRRSQRIADEHEVEKPRGFDDFELRLGDIMRGERATMGKSLLDVQRELRIKANYIAAIENTDPGAFDTPGFIAGYVRSYARYLGMDPERAFAAFCEESGFEVAHGMSAQASVVKKPSAEAPLRKPVARDPFTAPNTPFVPGRESVFSQIEPRAIGSSLVLLALIAGIGYGGWSVLKEVQQVQVAPVDQAPVVLSDLDPLQGAQGSENAEGAQGGMVSPKADALDRLYRPQALDVPVLVSRDAPISTLDPRTMGSFRAPDLPDVQLTSDQGRPNRFGAEDVADSVARDVAQALSVGAEPSRPQVLEDAAPSLTMVAVRPSWVRVTAPDGSSIYEKIMEPGETYEVPLTEEPPRLRTGDSGAIYFVVNGENYGPVGGRGEVTGNVALSIAEVETAYQVADLEQDRDLARVVAELQAPATPESVVATD